MVTTVSFDVVGEKELERVKRVLKETLSIISSLKEREKRKKTQILIQMNMLSLSRKIVRK
jgi:hypothetical protein